MQRTRRKPRRTQLERRNETQAAILSASIDLLARHGYAGFSASRVAAHAGVSRGAQEHYFPKKNDLIAAATRHAMREAVEHARSLARTATESADPVAKFLTDSEHFFFRPVFRAMAEIMIAARSDRALARMVEPIVQDARDVLNGIWIDTLDAAGYPRDNAQQFIELTHYLLARSFLRNQLAALPGRPRGDHRGLERARADDPQTDGLAQGPAPPTPPCIARAGQISEIQRRRLQGVLLVKTWNAPGN